MAVEPHKPNLLTTYVNCSHLFCTSSSRMHVMNHNWSATKQRLHPQCVAEISRHSVLSGDRIHSTMWNIVWVSPQGHRSESVSRHFLLQAPQCPCSVWKRFSRDLWCRGRSKLPDIYETRNATWLERVENDAICLWPRVTLIFDLLIPKVDCFMPLPSGPLVLIGIKSGSVIFKILYSQVW